MHYICLISLEQRQYGTNTIMSDLIANHFNSTLSRHFHLSSGPKETQWQFPGSYQLAPVLKRSTQLITVEYNKHDVMKINDVCFGPLGVGVHYYYNSNNIRYHPDWIVCYQSINCIYWFYRHTICHVGYFIVIIYYFCLRFLDFSLLFP